MKKTISYKVAQPPYGIKGGLSLRNLVGGQILDNQLYIPYNDPFLEARCVFLGREGAVLALATPKASGEGIEYRLCVASALVSQSFSIRGEYTKLMNIANVPALAKYIEQMMEAYDPLNGPVITQSIYTKAAVKIDESLSKAMASDESEIIDFSYEIEYFPNILNKYVTQAGNWFKTRNGEFYNPFANNEAGRMENLYIAERLGSEARQAQGNEMQKPDGSFISFWPVDIEDFSSGNSYTYDAQGLSELVNDGITALDAIRSEQLQVWDEEYAPA